MKKNLFKLLDESDAASNEVCENPTKKNCKELEVVTQLAIDVLTEEIKKRKAKTRTT